MLDSYHIRRSGKSFDAKPATFQIMKMVIDNLLAEGLNICGKRGRKRAFGRLDICIIIIGNDNFHVLTIYVPSKLSIKRMSVHYLFSLSEPREIRCKFKFRPFSRTNSVLLLLTLRRIFTSHQTSSREHYLWTLRWIF